MPGGCRKMHADSRNTFQPSLSSPHLVPPHPFLHTCRKMPGDFRDTSRPSPCSPTASAAFIAAGRALPVWRSSRVRKAALVALLVWNWSAPAAVGKQLALWPVGVEMVWAAAGM
eukprot:364732-Chlamydomonas_euryale.AAC.1